MFTITDPAGAAGLTERTVTTGSRDGVPTKIARARRRYGASRADLWDALTNPERLPRWFLPVSGDLRVGGRYQTQGNAGGVVETCDAPTRFAVTWEMGPVTSWLEVRLTEVEHGVELELTHEAPVDPGMWEQFGPGAVGVGWDSALLGLGTHLETGAALDPAEAEAFMLSSEGVEFARAAARGWADAAIADGDAADVAHAAAERTVAFYTTVPES